MCSISDKKEPNFEKSSWPTPRPGEGNFKTPHLARIQEVILSKPDYLQAIVTDPLLLHLLPTHSEAPDIRTPPAIRGELSYLAPLGSENISAPYFKQCFFQEGGVLPPRQSNTTPPSPKTEITNILFYILNLWRRTYCSGLRGCDTREKKIVI